MDRPFLDTVIFGSSEVDFVGLDSTDKVGGGTGASK